MRATARVCASHWSISPSVPCPLGKGRRILEGPCSPMRHIGTPPLTESAPGGMPICAITCPCARPRSAPARALLTQQAAVRDLVPPLGDGGVSLFFDETLHMVLTERHALSCSLTFPEETEMHERNLTSPRPKLEGRVSFFRGALGIFGHDMKMKGDHSF